jgi:nucleoside-diphosphate-sugar epimerase
MRVLILGGTEFVGRALVDEALARSWHVTTVNRGTRPASAGVTALIGDRRASGGLDPIRTEAAANGGWDLVVDTWSWEPWVVRDTARMLAPLAAHYAYISSRSVYAGPLPAGADESAPLVAATSSDGDPHAVRQAAQTESPAPDAATPALDVDYARGKAGAELAVFEAFGERALLARPGLVLGPYENIGRLPWWLARIARGGEVLAPGTPDATIQYVDARDLARWTLDAGSLRIGGAFNVVTPPGLHTLGELLEACIAATGTAARLRWVPAERILAAGISPWVELPVWLPEGEDHDAMHAGDVSKAIAAGLTFRLLTETVADTWAWLQSIGGVAPQRPDRPTVGLDPALERQLLDTGTTS